MTFQLQFGSPPVDGVTTIPSVIVSNWDHNLANALDGASGGTYAPSAVIEIGGAGFQVDKFWMRPRPISSTPYTVDGSGADVALSVDSSTGSPGFTVVLPAVASSVGRYVVIKDAKNQAATHPITIQRNNVADTIDNTTADLVISGAGGSYTLLGVTGGWIIIGKV